METELPCSVRSRSYSRLCAGCVAGLPNNPLKLAVRPGDMSTRISTDSLCGVLIVLVFAVPIVRADEIPKWTQAGEPLECKLSGEVSGPGHRMRIPVGFVGCPGWHRVFMVPIVDLSHDRYILVTYSTTPYAPESTLAESYLESYSSSEQHTLVKKIDERCIEIDGMPGERAVFRYYHVPTDSECISDTTTLTSTLPNPHLTDTPYFDLDLTLISKPEHYETDRKVLESMLSSIRQDPEAE